MKKEDIIDTIKESLTEKKLIEERNERIKNLCLDALFWNFGRVGVLRKHWYLEKIIEEVGFNLKEIREHLDTLQDRRGWEPGIESCNPLDDYNKQKIEEETRRNLLSIRANRFLTEAHYLLTYEDEEHAIDYDWTTRRNILINRLNELGIKNS